MVQGQGGESEDRLGVGIEPLEFGSGEVPPRFPRQAGFGVGGSSPVEKAQGFPGDDFQHSAGDAHPSSSSAIRG